MSGEEFTKPRLNGSLLPNYMGRQICLLGMAKNVRVKLQIWAHLTSGFTIEYFPMKSKLVVDLDLVVV